VRKYRRRLGLLYRDSTARLCIAKPGAGIGSVAVTSSLRRERALFGFLETDVGLPDNVGGRMIRGRLA